MTSAAWLAFKDAGWVSVIGLICVVVFALSFIVKKHARIESRKA